MSLLLPRRRILRAVIYIVSVTLVAAAADLVLIQLRREVRLGYQTTRLISPVLPDGSIDYLMAHESLYGQGVTPENNAAVPLIQALGREALPRSQPTDGITDRLGMAHLPDKGDYFIRNDNYSRDHSAEPEDSPFVVDSDLKWPLAIKPLDALWVKDNEKPLALIVEGSKRPRFFIPWYGGTRSDFLAETLLPHAYLVRDSARALLTRAVLRLEAGDISGFQDDVLAVHRLARLMAQTPTLVEQLVAWGPVDTGACRVERLAALSGKLSAEQLRGLAAQIAALGEMPSYVHCIDDTERPITLDIIQAIAHGSPALRDKAATVLCHGNFDHSSSMPDMVMRFWPIPCEEMMRTMNQYFDGMILAAGEATYPQRVAALNLWSEDIAKIHAQSQIWTDLSPDLAVSSLMLSPLACEKHFDEARMQRRLTLIALALAAYKADHGAYPASLGELAVDTNDLYVDRPVVYAQNDKGYVLYSVGPNMSDDGGKGDDVVVSVPGTQG